MCHKKSQLSFLCIGVGGGGGWRGCGAFLQSDLLGYDFGRYLSFYENATLNPHEYLKVGVQTSVHFQFSSFISPYSYTYRKLSFTVIRYKV